MSISEIARSYREQIRARANNWIQGNGYGPGGFHKNTAKHDAIFLLQHVADLEDKIAELEAEAQQAAAWAGRYYALVEEAEASRPRKIQTCGEGMKIGTVAIDSDGEAWQVTKNRVWDIIGGAHDSGSALDPAWGPYTIIYTPKEES